MTQGQRYTTQTLQSAAAATGNGNAMSGLEQFESMIVEVSGTFVATITWEISDDGTTWYGVNVTPLATGTKAATATTTGIFVVPTIGIKQFRARISAYTSGNVTVKARPGDAVVYP